MLGGKLLLICYSAYMMIEIRFYVQNEIIIRQGVGKTYLTVGCI